MERVDYVKRKKPKNEVEIRLWNMCYLSEERLPNEFVEAMKTYEEARKTWDEAWKTGEEALKTYEEAEKTYGEVWKTYLVEAWETWEKAGKTYLEAGKTGEEAEKTYNKILQISSPQILDLIKELVPDTAWNGKELVWKKKGQS